MGDSRNSRFPLYLMGLPAGSRNFNFQHHPCPFSVSNRESLNGPSLLYLSATRFSQSGEMRSPCRVRRGDDRGVLSETPLEGVDDPLRLTGDLISLLVSLGFISSPYISFRVRRVPPRGSDACCAAHSFFTLFSAPSLDVVALKLAFHSTYPSTTASLVQRAFI